MHTPHSTYAAVTTFSPKGYEQYGRRMLKTFDKYWPSEIILYVYWENVRPDYQSPRIVYRDLFSSSPDLRQFIERNKNNPKDESSKIKRVDNGIPTYDITHAGIRFAYKSYAIFDANEHATTDWIIWLDADTVTLKPIPLTLLNTLCPTNALVSYFGRTDMYSETGWVAYNITHPAHRALVNRMRQNYNEDRIYSFYQYHDCVNFDIARQETETLYRAHSYNISDVYHLTASHPIVNSPLGPYLDHLKGTGRKVKGRSFSSDYTQQSLLKRLASLFGF